ncbi:MAG: hypothetical protein K1X79_01050 [Oligoflexia bacterium]|nr:hypothetical protein [Oligoflexia bacterium]
MIQVQKEHNLAQGLLVEVMDLGFVLAPPNKGLRLYVDQRPEINFEAALTQGLEYARSLGGIRTVAVDLAAGDERLPLAVNLGFVPLCYWYTIPLSQIPQEGLPQARFLNTADAASIASKVAEIRMARQVVAPNFWTLAPNAEENHRDYLPTLINSPDNISVGIVGEGGGLDSFAIAMKEVMLFPWRRPSGQKLFGDGPVLLIDDFYAADLNSLLGHVAKHGLQAGYKHLVAMCSAHDSFKVHYFGQQTNLLFAWYAKTLV